MLSNDDIDKLAKPIQDDDEEYELAILLLFVTGILKVKKADKKLLRKMLFKDRALADIEALSSKHKFSLISHTKEIINKTGKISYQEAMHNLNPSFTGGDKAFKSDTKVQKIIKDVTRDTVRDVRKSVATQAFMLRDPSNPSKFIPTPLSKAYKAVITEAVNAAVNDSVDFDTLMRDSVRQLNASGIRRVSYNTETGKVYSQRLDTAVRRNILDGIRKVHQEIQLEIGKQMGADGVELSVHVHPAPDHAPVQGHAFSMEQFEAMQAGENFVDIEDKPFEGFARQIGTLNCKHFIYPIKIDSFKPTYSDKQLQKILDDNERGYTPPNGRHLTMYECTQYMRKLECDMRKEDDGLVLAKRLGDEVLCEQYRASLASKYKRYISFCKSCKLPPQKDRIKSYL